MAPKKLINFMNNILDDIFHPTQPICQIIKTAPEVKKPGVFTLLRPKSNTCLDYNISQTDLKLDAGTTKIHFQETQACYVPNKEIIKPKPKSAKRKRIRHFSGGPPQWEFVDEKWRREQEEKQKVYRQQLTQRLANSKKEKSKKKRKTRKH